VVIEVLQEDQSIETYTIRAKKITSIDQVKKLGSYIRLLFKKDFSDEALISNFIQEFSDCEDYLLTFLYASKNVKTILREFLIEIDQEFENFTKKGGSSKVVTEFYLDILEAKIRQYFPKLEFPLNKYEFYYYSRLVEVMELMLFEKIYIFTREYKDGKEFLDSIRREYESLIYKENRRSIDEFFRDVATKSVEELTGLPKSYLEKLSRKNGRANN